MGLGLSAEPAPQATLAGPFLSAPPTLEQVSEHQAGVFNSTMSMCDSYDSNMTPISFLLWLRKEGGRKMSPGPSFPRAIHLSSAVSQGCSPSVLAPFLAAQ